MKKVRSLLQRSINAVHREYMADWLYLRGGPVIERDLDMPIQELVRRLREITSVGGQGIDPDIGGGSATLTVHRTRYEMALVMEYSPTETGIRLVAQIRAPDRYRIGWATWLLWVIPLVAAVVVCLLLTAFDPEFWRPVLAMGPLATGALMYRYFTVRRILHDGPALASALDDALPGQGCAWPPGL